MLHGGPVGSHYQPNIYAEGYDDHNRSPAVYYQSNININPESYYDSYRYDSSQKQSSPKQYWTEIHDPELERVLNEPPMARTKTTSIEPKPTKERYREQLKELQQMGFEDGAENERLLEKHNGNLDKVVQELLASDLSPEQPVGNEKRIAIRYEYEENNKYDIQITGKKNKIMYFAKLLLYYHITLLDADNTLVSKITKEELRMHPTYAVCASNGMLIGTISQRFKMSQNRKFNYRLSNGTVLKMTGIYEKDFEIRKSGTLVATVRQKADEDGLVEIFVRPKVTKDQHIITMVLAMLERQFTRNLK